MATKIKSTISSEKRLKSDLKALEESSDHYISKSNYYIVKIKLDKKILKNSSSPRDVRRNQNSDLQKKTTLKNSRSKKSGVDDLLDQQINNIIKKLLSSDCITSSTRKCLSVYHHDNLFVVLYDRLSDDKKQSKGDTDYIDEIYSSNDLLEEGDISYQDVLSELVSLFSLTFSSQVRGRIIEFSAKIRVVSYLQYLVSEISRKVLLEISKGVLSVKDLEDYTWEESLKKLSDRKLWENAPLEKKYGKFYRTKNNKTLTLSEPIDFHHIDKYYAYLFDS